MQVKLKYGRDGLTVDLPETPGFQGVLRPKDAPVLADPSGEVERVIGKPIESSPLAELAEGKRSACIVISDVTRPVPNKILLPPILRAIEAAGIPREGIVILIATGTHRPNEGEELAMLVGDGIARNYRVVNHFCKRAEEMTFAGKLQDGTPVHINSVYADAELKILTGFIEPHMWAGYSGGRKAILPGISSLETVRHMHGPAMVAHPRASYGVLEGNPFHEAALAIMAKVGADFIVNVTLDASKRVTGVFAGNPVTAHERGCDFLAAQCVHTLDAPLDFVLTTNSGAPLDCNLYQTAKGMSAAAPGVKFGGVILIASACFEGVGTPEYEQVMEMVDEPERFLQRLMAHEFFISNQWCAQETYQVMRRHPTWLYTTGIPREKVRQYHFTPVADVEKAVTELLGEFGDKARWAVIPDGPQLILRSNE
jgi:nickel-dependent lactate racemase